MCVIGSLNIETILYQHEMTEAPNPTHFERHCHNRFEVLYVVRGFGRYIVEGAEYPLRPDTLLLTRPNEFHYVCPDSDQPYERYIINFGLGDLNGAAALLPMLQSRHGDGRGIYFPSVKEMGGVEAVFFGLDRLAELFGSGAEGKTLFCGEMSKLLLLLSLGTPATLRQQDETVVMRVIAHINASLSENLTLDELSKKFFISKYHLCRLFRNATGVSVLSYINTKRIAAANQMLSAGLPATEVAWRVGYGNYSSFYRVFCKQTGHAPNHRRGGEA